MRRIISTVLAALLLSALVGVAPAWSTSDPQPPLLSGRVSHGLVAAPGVAVRVSVFPAIPEQGWRPGRRVPLLQLDPTLTRPDGTFVVPRPSSARLRGFVDRWGLVDLTVTIDDGEVVAQHRASTPLSGDPGPATVTVDLADGRLHETLGAPGRHRLTLEDSTTPPRASTTARHPCDVTAGKKHLGRRERFMFVNNWVGAKATVLQLSGTSHTLGTATKLPGKSWSATDSHTRTIATSNQATQSNVVDRWVRNRVNYQDFHYRGLCEYPGEHTDRVPYSVHTLIADLRIRPTLPHLEDPAGCTPRKKNYRYTKDRTRNMTVERGVDLGTVKVSALSGWTNQTAWTVTVTKRSKECWSNEEGPEQSRYVQYFPIRRTEPCGRTARCSGPADERVQ
ncbi:hypothetical protein [Nocardioides sp.]|uniref:hypothetical protein n=1 Tax=Nocardioides sp. TaxID=35761 RepID=UPI003563DB08